MSEDSPVLSETTQRLHVYDKQLIQQNEYLLAGIDEAGRGSFAGPVIAAAVCLNYEKPIVGVNDSKKLSESARERIYECIVTDVLGWVVGMASPKEIDKYNILEATFLAMQRALDGLQCDWTYVLVDGNAVIPYISDTKQKTVVGGDACSASIAAASIVAKVTRDRIMVQMDETYPGYDFVSNKGYGTQLHRNSILDNGLCEIHRRSFCANLALQTRLPL